LFVIGAEDDDGILATGTDVEVGSSVQDVNQLNDCDAIFPPDPSCINFGVNILGLGASEDGDINLGESLQSLDQQNDCDNGTVACINAAAEIGNVLFIISDGPNAEVNLDTNTQQASQGNVCAVDGTTCDNTGINYAELTALDEAEVDIDDNTDI
jgi:hypothetical protein